MANVIDFLVKIKDMASVPLANIARTGGQSFATLSSAMNRTAGDVSKLSMSIRDIDKQLANLRKTREISLDGRQIRRINREIDELERKKSRLEGSNKGGFGLSSLAGLGLAGGVMGLVGGLGVGELLSKGSEKQMNAKSFEVLTGSAEVGGRLNSNLTQFAQDTIYGSEVFGQAKMMMNFGINEKAVMPAMAKLGDIASGDAQRMQSLSLVFSQVASAGRLTGQDLLQFVNAGFNPLLEISKKTGKSMADLRDEMSKGKISFKDVAEAIDTATGKGGKFYQMANKMAETGAGKMQALSGAWDNFLASTGEGLLDLMSPLFDFGQLLITTPDLLRDLGVALAGMAVLWGLWAAGVQLYTWAMGLYISITNAASIASWLLSLSISWPIVAIVALVAAILFVIAYFKNWGTAMENLWMYIKLWGSNVGILFENTFNWIGYHIERTWLKLKGFGQYLGEMFTLVSRSLQLAANMQFAEARALLKTNIVTSADKSIATLDSQYRAKKAENDADYAFNKSGAAALLANNFGLEKRFGGKKSMLDFGKEKLSGLIGGGSQDTSGAEAATKGITGGGVRNLTINVAKFFDDLNFNTQTTNEGVQDVESKMIDMFMRVVNSANAAID